MSRVRKCILAVEDDASIRVVYLDVLGEQGYRVEAAVDGEDALAQLKCSPDLILLDLQMPVMDGYTFLKRLRSLKDYRRTPVLVLTANHDGRPILEAQGLLRKPFAVDELLDQVAELLRVANGAVAPVRHETQGRDAWPWGPGPSGLA